MPGFQKKGNGPRNNHMVINKQTSLALSFIESDITLECDSDETLDSDSDSDLSPFKQPIKTQEDELVHMLQQSPQVSQEAGIILFDFLDILSKPAEVQSYHVKIPNFFLHCVNTLKENGLNNDTLLAAKEIIDSLTSNASPLQHYRSSYKKSSELQHDAQQFIHTLTDCCSVIDPDFSQYERKPTHAEQLHLERSASKSRCNLL